MNFQFSSDKCNRVKFVNNMNFFHFFFGIPFAYAMFDIKLGMFSLMLALHFDNILRSPIFNFLSGYICRLSTIYQQISSRLLP